MVLSDHAPARFMELEPMTSTAKPYLGSRQERIAQQVAEKVATDRAYKPDPKYAPPPKHGHIGWVAVLAALAWGLVYVAYRVIGAAISS